MEDSAIAVVFDFNWRIDSAGGYEFDRILICIGNTDTGVLAGLEVVIDEDFPGAKAS